MRPNQMIMNASMLVKEAGSSTFMFNSVPPSDPLQGAFIIYYNDKASWEFSIDVTPSNLERDLNA
jgi:hypothetical protein